ncbi:hypothetical protein D3C71_646470 [compost metagenome]
MFQRLGDDARRQAELDAVGDGQGLFIAGHADGRGDGAKDLLGVDARVRQGVGDQGRLDVPAGLVERQPLAARDHAAAAVPGDVDVVVGDVALSLGHRRTHLGLGVERVADAKRRDLLGQQGDEAVVDAVLHDQAARRGAALSGGEEAAVQGDGHRPLQVGVVQHDQRVLAAHLQLHPRLTLHRPFGHAGADGLRAGEADPVHARMGDDGAADVAVADDHVDHALGQARLMQDGDQGLGRGGRRPGGLEHHRIAEGDGRGDLPRRNGDGEVPRRDQAEHPDRLPIGLDLDARTRRGQVLAVDPQGLAGEIFQDAGGAHRLAHALGQGLALFTRQQAADLRCALHQQRPGPVQHVETHLRRGVGPAGKGGPRRLHRLIHLGRPPLGRAGHDLANVGRVQALARQIPAYLLAADPVRKLKRVRHGKVLSESSGAAGERRPAFGEVSSRTSRRQPMSSSSRPRVSFTQAWTRKKEIRALTA